MTTQIVYRSNDHLIKLTGLQDSSDDTFVNDATVTLTMKDINDVNVVGISWPLAMAYVAASNGDYEGTIDKALVITPETRYFAEVTIVSGTRDAFFELPVQAQKRES